MKHFLLKNQCIGEVVSGGFRFGIYLNSSAFEISALVGNVSQEERTVYQNSGWADQEYYHYSPYGSRIQVRGLDGVFLKNDLLSPDCWYPIAPMFLWTESIDLEEVEQKILQPTEYWCWPVSVLSFFQEIHRIDENFLGKMLSGFEYRIRIPCRMVGEEIESDWLRVSSERAVGVLGLSDEVI